MKKLLSIALFIFLCLSCVSTSDNKGKETHSSGLTQEQSDDTESGTGLSLLEAVEQSAENIANELPPGSRVAIVAFESANASLSDFIMEEITGALFDRGIEVADRQNLDYVYKELNFQMSGDVSDETAQSIGKFLAAQLVITGQLTNLGGTYRYRASAIHVEKATRDSVTRLMVRNDREMQSMVTALASQTTVVKVAKYGVSDQTTPKTAGTFLDRGILFAARGDFEMAIADFTEAININPDLSAAYKLRAKALSASVLKVIDLKEDFSGMTTLHITGRRATTEQLRIFDQATADLNQAIRLDPNDAIAYSNRGLVYHYKDDFDRAMADYNTAIRLDPNSVSVYTNRGNTYFYKSDYDRAIADYSHAIRLDPNDALAYTNRGNAYQGKRDYDRAIADYSQAIRLDPNFDSAYTNRGAAYKGKRDYDRAIADFNQAIRLDPNSVSAYTNRGNAYQEKRDYDRAIADFNQAIRLDSNFASAYTSRGNAYQEKGDYDRAIADYNQAIRLDPNFAIAYTNRGGAYAIKGDYDRAIADCNQAIRLDPNYANSYTNRGAAYLEKGDYDRAIADLNQAIRLDPNNANAYNNRGNTYFVKTDYDRAIADYNQAIRFDPNTASTYVNCGNAYYNKGDYNRAIADYETALRIDPNAPYARQNLEAARQQRGR